MPENQAPEGKDDGVVRGTGGPVQSRWRAYANVVVRMRQVDQFAATESGTTANGAYRLGFGTPGERQLLVGVHVAKLPLAFHLTYYRYRDDSVLSTIPSELDWVDFSFERRF